ncbi:MAG: thermonuclease family protein [Nitrosopumilus sp.]|nr:MAG: thermonuclease family protein [Nitrosopumilus sp.]
MKKGMMIGIGIIIVIIAGYGITQNQDTESISDDSSVEIAAENLQTSDASSKHTQSMMSNTFDTSKNQLQDCSGSAKCVTGTVTKIIDGDTIHVNEQSVRFALTSAPNLEGYGGADSRDFIQTVCPVGSEVLIDEDDGHVLDDHARIVGMITCNGVILNQELLDANLGHLEIRFCPSSEFANETWAIKHGCVRE